MHPCPPSPPRRNSLGGEITGHRLGTTGIQIPARQKIFKKIRKNEDFKNVIAKLKISAMNNLSLV